MSERVPETAPSESLFRVPASPLLLLSPYVKRPHVPDGARHRKSCVRGPPDTRIPAADGAVGVVTPRVRALCVYCGGGGGGGRPYDAYPSPPRSRGWWGSARACLRAPRQLSELIACHRRRARETATAAGVVVGRGRTFATADERTATAASPGRRRRPRWFPT